MSRVPADVAKFRTLQAFDNLCEVLGRAPSTREVSRALGLHPLGAQKTIAKLIDEGWILAKKRTIRQPTRLSAAAKQWLERAKTER